MTHATDPDVQAKIDTWNTGKAGGVAVAYVDESGARFYQTGHYATADDRPITSDTQFEIGSVTKVFTSLLLAESERVGKVRREDPVTKYLHVTAPSEDLARLDKVTLLMLATHTSGLPRLPSNLAPADPRDPYADFTTGKLLVALAACAGSVQSPAPYVYSNFGAGVLGQALAVAWGESYPDALRRHVLEPLGLARTTLATTDMSRPKDMAPGHNESGELVANWTFDAIAPAGGLRSSTREMAAFIQSCLGLRPTPLAASLAATMQPRRPLVGLVGSIGLAWHLTADKHPIIWHNGGTGGYHSFVGFEPYSRHGVVILVNSSQSVDALGFGLLRGEEARLSGRTAPAIDATATANLADYVGRYPLAPTFVISVTADQGRLVAQATGQQQLILLPVASDRFNVKGVDAEISFERDASSKVVALILRQNGLDQRAPRSEASLPVVITLPPEVLREYAGEYPILPQFVLTVTEKDGQLAVQATGQSQFPVFASATDEFFYTVVDARISFQRDATGRVSGLVLHQAGRDLPAAKQ